MRYVEALVTVSSNYNNVNITKGKIYPIISHDLDTNIITIIDDSGIFKKYYFDPNGSVWFKDVTMENRNTIINTILD